MITQFKGWHVPLLGLRAPLLRVFIRFPGARHASGPGAELSPDSRDRPSPAARDPKNRWVWGCQAPSVRRSGGGSTVSSPLQRSGPQTQDRSHRAPSWPGRLGRAQSLHRPRPVRASGGDPRPRGAREPGGPQAESEVCRIGRPHPLAPGSPSSPGNSCGRGWRARGFSSGDISRQKGARF